MMTRKLSLLRTLGIGTLCAALLPAQATQRFMSGGPTPVDPQGPDLLRFSNGDVIHGSFAGFSQTGLDWNRADLAQGLSLQTAGINQIVFNGGRPREALPNSAYLRLKNGDEIPGSIVSLDDKNLIIDSPVAGIITVPRDSIASIFPNPEGGKLIYTGPYNTDNWTLLTARPEPGQEKVVDNNEKRFDDEGNPIEETDEQKKTPNWIHAGAAWYSYHEKPIILDANLPDKARVTFKLAWRNRLNVTIAFHANMKHPDRREQMKEQQAQAQQQAEALQQQGPQPEIALKLKKKPELKWESLTDMTAKDGAIPWVDNQTRNNHAEMYGESYVMTLYSSNPTLYRNSFTPEGMPTVNAIRATRSQVNLENSQEAEFDLRLDRTKNSISLYINGEFVMQWEDSEGYAGTGGFLAFTPNSNSRLRVSDVVISEWNGMTDAARSMDHDERDILLLNNGTDRFSGKIKAIEGKTLVLENEYSSLNIPLADINQIHMKNGVPVKKGAEDAGGDSSSQAILYYQPHGRITLTPQEATKDEMKALSPVLGELKLNLRPAVLLEFSPGNPALEGWDDAF